MENFSTGHCSLHCRTPFQVHGVYRETRSDEAMVMKEANVSP